MGKGEAACALPTTEALRIAGLKRYGKNSSKFHEAVHDGFYPCVMRTRQGATRIFARHHLVGLCVFRRLLDLGLPGSKAGPAACEAQLFAELYPSAPAWVWDAGDGVRVKVDLSPIWKAIDGKAP